MRPAVRLAAAVLAALSAGAEPKLPQRVADALFPFVQKGQIAGAVAVVGDAREVLVLEAVGDLDVQAKRAMPKDAVFRIASMTKPITAIGVMQLAEDGKLSIDDPVEKHLPEFKGPWLIAERKDDALTLKRPQRPVTLRDLLTHTSGLPGGYPPGLSDLYEKRDRTLAEAVLAISQRPLEFAPGSKWAYCNPGIDTLGRVIEVRSGMPYEAYLAKRVFEPLGMKDTTFFPSEEQLKRLAALYDSKDGKLIRAREGLLALPPGAKHPIPAGGLYSTGADLARLYQAMLNGGRLGDARVLKEESVKAMTTVQTGDLKTGFTPGMGWGLGWAVVREPQGVTAPLSAGSYGHGGAFGTQAWIDPHKGRFVVLLIQRAGLPNSDASEMRDALQKAALAAE
jgi:CubicO group peptidase (beta-lactamase class C family)